MQFEKLVHWVVRAEEKINQICQGDNTFDKVRFNPIIGAIINLVDAKVLDKELQLGGIKLLRKIVEVENVNTNRPAADWDTDDWIGVRQNIKLMQDRLSDRGTIPFLCKLISDTEDQEIQMECLLGCIALLLGGNIKTQDAFFEYMTVEDHENRFLNTI